jgi:hypothetical protein
MTPYATAIAAAIGSTDPAMIALVEEIMREDRSGLDSLPRAQFDAEARSARADIAGLAAAGLLQEYCDALGVATPHV